MWDVCALLRPSCGHRALVLRPPQLIANWEIRNVCRRLHQNKNGKTFFGGFVNNDMPVVPNIILHVDVLQANIFQRFGFNPYILQLFPVSSCYDEVNEHSNSYLTVLALNASPIHYICQVLLRGEIFDHYTPILRRMSVFICAPGTVKTETIMSIIAGIYYMMDYRGPSVIQFENLRRQCRNDISKTRGRRFEHSHVNNTIRRVKMPKSLPVAPMNNVVNVFEDHLQQGSLSFDERTNRWMIVSPIYRRLKYDDGTFP